MTAWSARFETGHPKVDAEHREFFRQLNTLKEAVDDGAGREVVVELITILQRYAQGHFEREEDHMERFGCEALEANRAAHREFSRKLEGWIEILTFSGTPVSVLLDVHRESTAWIEKHIVNVDCRLRGCVLARKED